ncbi:MAG: redox-sensing transcriptional repressor Rex [Desulfobacteraceae bacterium]|nr:MAG: redox-sensing transcriptional repressor Rex [Desulfobacteraceae bacterium]
MSESGKVPAPTIERLAIYSRPLEDLLESGTPVVSSERLAILCGVNPAQVRKDLAYFGEFGVRGLGYEVRELLRAIRTILATDRVWHLCIVGMGNLGRALVENENFKKRGYLFAAAFDVDNRKVGERLRCGLAIEPIAKIKELVGRLNVDIGVITTPQEDAQRVADLLTDAGVKSLLNFAPLQVRAPASCFVEHVDLGVKLENLAYHLTRLRGAKPHK